MKNFNLTLALIPQGERESLQSQVQQKCPNNYINFNDDWIYRKSLSTNAITNYKCVIECIFKIIKDNLSEKTYQEIKLTNNSFCVSGKSASEILNITKDFTSTYKLAIQKELSDLIYKYELKTSNEIFRELNNHMKIFNDYLKLSNDNFNLIIACSHVKSSIN